MQAGGGDDLLVGTAFDDILNGEGGDDSYNAQGGNDSVSARDDIAELIDCGAGLDTVNRDSSDTQANCETDRVGVLSLTSGRAKVGATTALKLAWKHPRSWKQLKRVTLTVRDERGAAVGALAIDPRRGKLTATPLDLRLKGSKLTRAGKRVSARITIRPTAALAGRTLTAEVEAVDRRGARQVETEAGTIRVRR